MIVGLTGIARSGKDTAGVYIERHFGIPTIAFADPLKAALVPLFGITPEMAQGVGGYDREQLVPPWNISVREMTQKLGTECVREVFCKDFLVRRMEAEVDSNEQFFEGFVVTDVRFDNEAQWIKDRGGVILHLHRQVDTKCRGHKSEDGIRIELIDKHIPNESTVEDLHLLLREALE